MESGNFDAPSLASMNEFLNDLKAALVSQLEEARNLGNRVGDNKVGQAHVNAKMEVLTKLVIFVDNAIKEGVFDMKELKLELGESGSLDELLSNQRGGIVEPEIKRIAETLKPGQYKAIDPEAITWGHFAGRVYDMRNKGKLPKDFGPMKRGDKFYLVRYTPEMLKAEDGKKKRDGK